MDRLRSELRLTDAEREAAIARLSEHYAVGRLDKDEFDERSDSIWSAKTQGQLAPVFADLELPAPPRPAHSRGTSRRRRHHGFPIPFMPLLVALIVLTVITHLPFILIGLAIWCFAGHRFRLNR